MSADEQDRRFNEEQIRDRVRHVMASWRAYPNFPAFFRALLQANLISGQQFARRYAQATGRALSTGHISHLQAGDSRPTYRFLADIADHALLAPEPHRLQSPSGDYRFALFAAAGLVEVTPASIHQWNAEVLAGWQRLARPNMTWPRLMSKLVSFHTQGRRRTYNELALAANGAGGPHCQLNRKRFADLLSSFGVSTKAERLGIAAAAGLDASQIGAIEAAIEDGTLPLNDRPAPSMFSLLLTDILEELRIHGITQRQLGMRTRRSEKREPEMNSACLSVWKHSRATPTQASLRELISALETCLDRDGRPIISAEKRKALASGAGFTLKELFATTHEIIAGINGETRIKPLLSALRNAADLNASRSSLTTFDNDTSLGSSPRNWESLLMAWEHESIWHWPSAEQVSDLLTRYNRLLAARGEVPMRPDEIEKVVAVAERDREQGPGQTFRAFGRNDTQKPKKQASPSFFPNALSNRARQHRSQLPRRTVAPDFTDGASR